MTKSLRWFYPLNIQDFISTKTGAGTELKNEEASRAMH
jgi:hypothetical protein